MNDTRRRIVQAVVELHEEIGPASTTITAIAQRAGVQRLTVYRHFPDDRALLHACSAHWAEDHPLPDPISWAGIEEPAARLKAALGQLYDYFRDGAAMLESILPDEAGIPELAEVMAPWWEYMREVAGGLAAGWGVDGYTQRLVRATVGHAIAFHTWRSLSGEGLTNEEAVSLMAALVEGVVLTDGAASLVVDLP